MGKPTGFLEFNRSENKNIPCEERIKNYDEFKLPLSEKERETQGARCMDCGVPLCQSAMMLGGAITGCPLHNLIPEWNNEVYHGHFTHALSRLLKTNNFPEFTGRVCPALCESACICGMNDSPVTIHDNEKFIIENAFEKGLMTPKIPEVRSGKRIAIIGSGPAGLAAADQLNHRGHSVTVFEKADRAGGLLMYGIPNMKLDKSVVDRRINLMIAEGVEFVLNADIGSKDYPAKELKDKFDAIILCCGSEVPRKLEVAEIEKTKGVSYAVPYLTESTKALLEEREAEKILNAKGKHVVIVGGGDTGNDCLATAIRQGAKSITQLIRRPAPPKKRSASNPWPEVAKVLKTDYGQEEAIAVFGKDPRLFETAIQELEVKDGMLKGLKISTVTVDENRKTTPVPGTEKNIKCELLLLATGFSGSMPYISDAFGVKLTSKGNIETEENSYKAVSKSEKEDCNIFAAGDMHRGQSLVVFAIAEGRACAKEVDKYLMSYTNME